MEESLLTIKKNKLKIEEGQLKMEESQLDLEGVQKENMVLENERDRLLAMLKEVGIKVD